MRHYPPAVLAIAETLVDPDKPDVQDQDLYFSLSGYIGASADSSFLLLSLELSDTKGYEPEIRALLETASQVRG